MKYVGAHVSTQGGVANAPLNAHLIGARAFAFFTKNQRRWFENPYSQQEIGNFKKNLQISGILPKHLLAHASYLLNLGSPDQEKRELSVKALIDEVKRCEELSAANIVFHPGSNLKKISEAESMDYIANSINQVISATNKVNLVIENTAGQGGNLGYKFEQLAYIIAGVTNKDRVGVCIDTCHLFASGYDFLTKDKYEAIWELFDQIVGFSYLKGLHLNDSKGELGSRIDRHDSLGYGNIGLDPFKLIMQDGRFDGMPLILETIDESIWEKEIKLLYGFME